MNYDEPEWKNVIEKALDNCNSYHDEVKKNYLTCIDCLHKYACSKTYGLS